MKDIAVIHYRSVRHSNWSLLTDAAHRSRITLHSFEPHRFQLYCTDRDLEVRYAGEAFRPDVVLHRTVAFFRGIIVPVLAACEENGSTVLNEGEASYASRDKVLTYLALRQGGVPIVESVALVDPEGLELDSVARGQDIIVKPSLGVRGEGIRTYPSTGAVIEEWRVPAFDVQSNAQRETYLAQPLVAGGGHDIRAFVVGEECMALMERTAGPGEVRANLHLGATGSPLPLHHPAAEVAVHALRAAGLDYGGVDLIEDESGVIRVLEVDAWAGFSGITATTGVDVAGAILRLALQRHRENGTR